MKKINILIIISDHFSTLRDDRDDVRSWGDVAVFYVLPFIVGLGYFFFPFPLPASVENSLIAIFSVFGALLFSAQIALYSLSPKPLQSVGDDTSDAVNQKKYEKEKKFFQQVNFNVSYLILISCISLVIFLGMTILDFPSHIEGAVLTAIVLHFFLTLLMLIKRTHVVFKLRHSG